jgi:prepilin-type N-terminal cleavage/methylation domain-containing protein
MNLQQQRGFTLWELLMTLLVAGILLGIGVPNVMEFQRNGLMTAAANELVTAVLVARTEAVKRQAPVTMCLSDDPLAATPTCLPNAINDSATRGFIVWVDENNNFDANGARILTDGTDGNAVVDANELVIRRSTPPGGSIRVSSNCGYATYLPTGFTRQVAALCFPNPFRTVLLCDDRGRRVAAGSLSSARVVRIDRPGRGQVLQETVVINPVIIALGATCP